MTETSALQQLMDTHRNGDGFSMDAYRAALEADWTNGRPEEIAEYDSLMALSGGVIRTHDGFEGYVGTLRFDKTQLSEFRSIVRKPGSNWREVVAKDVDGRVWHVGNLKRRKGQWAENTYGVPGPPRRPDLPLDTTRPAYPPRGS